MRKKSLLKATELGLDINYLYFCVLGGLVKDTSHTTKRLRQAWFGRRDAGIRERQRDYYRSLACDIWDQIQ